MILSCSTITGTSNSSQTSLQFRSGSSLLSSSLKGLMIIHVLPGVWLEWKIFLMVPNKNSI
jgi:hypothetical protein